MTDAELKRIWEILRTADYGSYRQAVRPDVPGPLPYLPDGGNWEGGTTDTRGRHWHHVPNVGWELWPARHPIFGPPRRPWWSRLLQRKRGNR